MNTELTGSASALRKDAILRDNAGKMLAKVAYPAGALMDEIVSRTLSGGEYPVPDFLVRKPVLIVDVGANVGAASVFFACVFPEARLFAYEPAPHIHAFAAENLQPFALAQVFPCGWYSRNCTVPLYTGLVGSATSSVVPSRETGSDAFDVKLVRGADELSRLRLEYISILKLDTEGCEVPILEDLVDWLERIETILVEYHSEEDRRAIDRLLEERFSLFFASSRGVHRGVAGYVAKSIAAKHPKMDPFAIRRPEF